MLKPLIIKPLLATAAVLALAGGSFVYAQQNFAYRGFGAGPRAEFRHGQSAADAAAFADARIAALKAGLELTPDQAKNWPPFEQAVRDLVQLRIRRIQAREAGNEQNPASPFDRLARRADDMAKRSTALKKVADAGAPLYQSLNDEQKGRFVRLARILRPHRGMHEWRRGEGYGRGFGHDGRRFGQERFGQEDDGTPSSQL